MKTPSTSEERPDPLAQKSTHRALKQLKFSFTRNLREDVCEVKETYGLLYIKNRNIILMGSAH